MEPLVESYVTLQEGLNSELESKSSQELQDAIAAIKYRHFLFDCMIESTAQRCALGAAGQAGDKGALLATLGACRDEVVEMLSGCYSYYNACGKHRWRRGPDL